MRSKILYEDEYMIAVHKPAGLAAQTNKLGQQDLVSEIKNYISIKRRREEDTKNTDKEPYVGLIHRLDQPVEGIILLAKNEFAAAALSAQIAENKMKKYYYAVIYGEPEQTSGVLENYLLKDRKTNLSKVVPNDPKDRNVKRAELMYQCIRTVDKLPQIGEESVQQAVSLINIQLKTGRHHQIRVQLAHAGFPLLGDNKYGTAESIEISRKMRLRNVALCAYQLNFVHPKTKKEMQMQIEPDTEIFKQLRPNYL